MARNGEFDQTNCKCVPCLFTCLCACPRTRLYRCLLHTTAVVCTCLDPRLYTCLYARLFKCLDTCLHRCLDTCLFSWLQKCLRTMSAHMSWRTMANSPKPAADMHTRVQTSACTCPHTCLRICPCPCTGPFTCLYTCLHTYPYIINQGFRPYVCRAKEHPPAEAAIFRLRFRPNQLLQAQAWEVVCTHPHAHARSLRTHAAHAQLAQAARWNAQHAADSAPWAHRASWPQDSCRQGGAPLRIANVL